MVKIAFYKAWKGNWVDWAIALWTWGKYSHVELVLSDSRGFTASGRDNEVRIKHIDFDNGKWDVIEVAGKINWVVLNKMLGHKYDKLGILFHEIFHIPVNSPYRYYCSEAVSCALDLEPCDVDPVKLYKKLTE